MVTLRHRLRRVARPPGRVFALVMALMLGGLSPALVAEAEGGDVSTAPDKAIPDAGTGAASSPAEAPELLLWQEIPTVISASRREEPATRAPNAVSVVTADQIHGSGLMTVGELLRLVPGVDVGRIDGGAYAVGVRGMHGKWANNTLVLMDGRTVYNPGFGGTQWMALPVFLEDIDRIEVVRGPGGAAWGANAANGVINIITKDPKDTQGLFLSQTLTSRLDSLTHMRYGFSEGPLEARLSAGYDSLPELGVREGDGNHDFVRLTRANLRSTYHLDEHRSLDVDAGYADGTLGCVSEEVLITGRLYDSARWSPQTHFLRMRYTERTAPDNFWYIQYFMNRETWSQSDGGLWGRYTQHDVEAQRVQPWGDDHVLTWGGNVRVDIHTNGDPPAGAGLHGARFDNERSYDHQGGLFLQDRWELADHWTTVVGVRTDRNSYTGWEWAGRGTVLYHPVEAHTFRVSMARAFRTPTLSDRETLFQAGPTGLPLPFPQFGAVFTGSEDLNSTYVKAYEFGYTFQQGGLRLGAEFFWNNYRGIIAPATLSPPGAVPQLRGNRNVIDGDLYGFELTGTWQATDRLILDGWYAWETWVQQGTRTRTQGSLTGPDLAYPPRQKVSVGARYELAEGLSANARMWWVDEIKAADAVHVDPYARFDFGVTKRLGERCELGVGVLNAFDPRHGEMRSSGQEVVEVGERTWYIRFQADF